MTETDRPSTELSPELGEVEQPSLEAAAQQGPTMASKRARRKVVLPEELKQVVLHPYATWTDN